MTAPPLPPSTRFQRSARRTAGLSLALTALPALLVGCAAPAANPSAPGPGAVQIMCPMDVMQCPGGEWVGRQPPACQFVCPPATPR